MDDKTKLVNDPAGAESGLSERLATALVGLISEWEREAKFLSNPNDHPQDRAVGKAYAECATKLRNLHEEWEAANV